MAVPTTLLSGVAARCFDAQTVDANDPDAERDRVDGRLPRVRCAPADLEEAAAVLAWVSGEGAAVIARGGGTRLDLGNPPRAFDVLLSTERLARVLEYEPADLTVTVQAGVTLAALQRVLAERGQHLPIDPSRPDRSTIGGILAANAFGPLRMRHGSMRDLVIGTRTCQADGQIARAGGKVVKNVSGYDLNKLYIGSLGTLGLVGEITLKVQPLPETTASVAMHFAHVSAAFATADRLVRSPIAPAALALRGPGRDLPSRRKVAGDGPFTLLALHAGFAAPVRRQVDDTIQLALLAGSSAPARLDGADADRLWREVRDADVPAGDDARRALAKVAVPMSQLEPVVLAALGEGAEIVAYPGVGILYSWLRAESVDELAALLRRLRAHAIEREGSLVVQRASSEAKRGFDVWGGPISGLEIMRRIKAQLDPAGVLSPGRFVGGI